MAIMESTTAQRGAFLTRMYLILTHFRNDEMPPLRGAAKCGMYTLCHPCPECLRCQLARSCAGFQFHPWPECFFSNLSLARASFILPTR